MTGPVDEFLGKLAEDFTGQDKLVLDLPNGQTVTFRVPNDYVELQSIATQSVEWCERAKNWTALPAWSALLHKVDDATLQAVYQLATLVVDPPLEHIHFLGIARNQGFVFAQLWNGLNAAMNANMLGASKREITEGNEDSATIQTEDGSLPHPPESTDEP